MVTVQKSFTPDLRSYGSLYLVATPIGSLEDITIRAIRVLKEVQWIAAEDTRQTRKLLAHYEITTRMISYHEHNKQASGPELIRILQTGDSIALVSDAGTPAISDPGYELVKLAIDKQISVVAVPGANAAINALIVSGLPTDSFYYMGFLPRERKAMMEQLEQLRTISATIVVYESPHRIIRTLEALYEAYGDRPIAVIRELTKKFEEICRGKASDCITEMKSRTPLGEYCIVIGGMNKEQLHQESQGWWQKLQVHEHVAHYKKLGFTDKEAMKQTAVDRGVAKRDVYNELLKQEV